MYSLQPTAAAPMHLGDGLLERTGGTIGRYELLQPLGGGELGLVFAGRHKVLRKRVAIKVLPPELADSALVPARFLRDAQVASQLDHENIISVTDFGRDRLGNLYMVMELLAGRTLRDELADNPVGMSLERALPILRQLCRAVSFAHKAGVVHRDICPKNIFVGEHGGKKDFVKLADFGMSYVAGRAEEDVAVATTPYVSPEQLRGEGDQDHRVDVYAIGVLAFELLTGTLPFRSDDARELAAQKLSWEPLRLTHTQLGDSYPQLARLIAECLSADRDQRPATVVELEQRLASCDGGAATEVEDLAGLRAGSYRLEKLLGRGGLGSVWLAAHPVIGSRVAIKVLHSQVCESEDAVNRLVLEAQAVNRIDSPNIVKIFDFGKLDDGRDYAVMELLEGETLAARLRRLKRMRWEEVGDLAIQVSEALVVAHRAGVVHRDLKPENVFLCGDPQAPLVKLLDFGIAELVDDGVGGSSPSKRWFALGTPLYVAPEQAAGEPVGPSADVYALGAMLYELLTGQAPFVGTVSEVLTAKMTSRASSIAERCPELDPTVAQLIDGALAMNPEDRPVSLRVLQTLYEAAPPPSGEWSVSGEAPIRPSSSWRRPGSGLIGIARMPSGEWVQQHRPATPGGVSSGSGEWARAPQPAVAPHVVEPHVVEPHVVEPSQPQAQEATARDATPMMPPSAAPPPVPSALPVLAAEEEGSAPVAAVLPRVPRLRTPVGLPAPS
ncbi:MAG: serine/threonine protein kinase, partial [Myxococcales bacterium]|nr:serine/threonine protein kinase [Myxococcales bacterium]